ncbi:PleD family two-component system response regulator [Candidatus Omnitrophota bacterium]
MEKKKILIVDDEVDLVELLNIRLKVHNYYVVPLYVSTRTIETAKKLKPDLILLDVMMPDKDGYEICRELKSDKDTKDIPVMLFTAKPDQKAFIKNGSNSVGADDFILKPFDAADLLIKIGNLLRK